MMLGRNWSGIEMNPEYIKMAEKRIKNPKYVKSYNVMDKRAQNQICKNVMAMTNYP